MAHLGSKTPIADRRYQVVNFRTDQDFRDIRHKLLITNTIFEDDCFLEYLGWDREWKRAIDIVSDPLFIDGKPTRFDALQGDLSDCWLIGPIEALTMHTSLINHVVPPDQNFTYYYTGAFHFRIWNLGIWNDVVVDDRLPVFRKDGSLCYCHSLSGKVFWAALLEKAYAKITARDGTPQKRYLVDYNDLSFGIALRALQDLTGGIVERLRIHNPPFLLKIDDLMKEIHTRNDLMVTHLARKFEEVPLKGLFPQHTYAVTKVFEVTPEEYHGLSFVRVMNPTGNLEWKGDWSDDDEKLWKQIDRGIRERMGFNRREDGEFWMDVNDFLKRFQYLDICHLEPTQFLDVRKLHRQYDTWHFTEARGEWIEDITAVGSDISTRHLNPQIMFQFDKPEPDQESYQSCKVVVELTHRSSQGRVRMGVAFYIYFGLACPLTHQNLLDLEPQDGYPDFWEGVGITFVSEGYFRPGKFVVIPCTEEPDWESYWLLRVFSPCPVKIVLRSRAKKKRSVTELAQALPFEDQSAIESTAIPTRMFIDTAQGSSEIDWIGLKDLLEEAFNPGGSIFERILNFFKNIPAFFEINLLRSSDDKENGKVIFTKDECRSMIAMYDENHSGKLDISEFCELWKKICFWTKIYDRYRDEVDGYLKVARFRDALDGMGYDVPTRTVHSLSYVYSDEQGIILLTDFILCGVTLETTLSLVEKADIKDDGNITFTLDEWVKKTLIL